MSEHNAWMTFDRGVCAICGKHDECADGTCSRACWVELYWRMIRYNCFYSIVVAACEVAKVQQAMLDRGWTPPPEEPVRYTDGIEPPQPPRGKWVAITHLYQHDDNLSMSVELGSPGTWEWFLRDERLDHWIVARGTAPSCAEAMHDVVCALVKYEAKLTREQAIMWDANHDCREAR